MLKGLLAVAVLLVSALSQGVPPSWTRDQQIDAGEVKAVNFQVLLANSSLAFLYPSMTASGAQHFNKSNFGGVPRVIVGMKSYGMLPAGAFTLLNAGFRFAITGRNATHFTYSVTSFGVTVVGLHYQYLAVLGYDHLYYMQLYSIPLNSSHAVADPAGPAVRSDQFSLPNPAGLVTGDNFTSSEMVLQAWPYYFLFTPTGSALSFSVAALPSSPTAFSVTLTADSGCALLEVGISVLYLNKTKMFEDSYSQVVDVTTFSITGNDLAGAQTESTAGNITLLYQFRNSGEGIQGIFLPFSPPASVTAWYFISTSSNASRLHYRAIQQRWRLCASPNLYFLVDDALCYAACPAPRYATNATFKYCKKCHYSCLECSSADLATACTACEDSAARTLSNSSCLCNLTYFDNGSELCAPCHSSCLTCSSGEATGCLSCDADLLLSGSQCVASSTLCGNGVVEAGEECDDGNVDSLDGCSSGCEVEQQHFCLNNLTAASVCYYDGQISFSREEVFKVPLENRVQVRMLVSAPNCNASYLQRYLEQSVGIELSPAARVLASGDISSQRVQFEPATAIARLDFQYSQDIDLASRQVRFAPSLDYSQAPSRYFYASPSAALTLSAPDNLLLTTYASPGQLAQARAVALAFAAMIALVWVFWLVSLCYHQTASAVEFMLVAQVAFEALLQRKFITDGWVGLVLYGKHCYGYNVDYPSPLLFDRLRILSLNSYLFHTLNLSTALLLLTVVAILAVFCYETAKVGEEDRTGDLNVTEAKLEASSREGKDGESEYRVRKGITLVLFEVGASFTLLTVKIAVVSVMLATAATAVDAAVVGSILAVCYFLVWYFVYRFYEYDFLKDFSFKRLLREPEDASRSRSVTARAGNFFVKFYYLCIFCLLVLFGVADALPSLGAPFYVAVAAGCLAFLLAAVVFGAYFRTAHSVRAGCNLLALAGVMVLHLQESLQVGQPAQSLTGPIVCLCILYAAFALNFGLMAYIELRRHRTRKPKYRAASNKVAPADLVLEFNYTEEPHLPRSPLPAPIPEGEEPAEEEIRRSDKSRESLVHESKFESLKSRSHEHSLSETHKKLALPRPGREEDTKQKEWDLQDYVVVRERVDDQGEGEFEERSEVERLEIMDISRSVSDFAKTKPKFAEGGREAGEEGEEGEAGEEAEAEGSKQA